MRSLWGGGGGGEADGVTVGGWPVVATIPCARDAAAVAPVGGGRLDARQGGATGRPRPVAPPSSYLTRDAPARRLSSPLPAAEVPALRKARCTAADDTSPRQTQWCATGPQSKYLCQPRKFQRWGKRAVRQQTTPPRGRHSGAQQDSSPSPVSEHNKPWAEHGWRVQYSHTPKLVRYNVQRVSEAKQLSKPSVLNVVQSICLCKSGARLAARPQAAPVCHRPRLKQHDRCTRRHHLHFRQRHFRSTRRCGGSPVGLLAMALTFCLRFNCRRAHRPECERLCALAVEIRMKEHGNREMPLVTLSVPRR